MQRPRVGRYFTCTWENNGDVSWAVIAHRGVPRPGVAAVIGFAAQAKLVRPVREHRSVRSSHTLPFGFNPGDARDRSLC